MVATMSSIVAASAMVSPMPIEKERLTIQWLMHALVARHEGARAAWGRTRCR